MSYGYLGPYLLVDKPKSTSVVGYSNFESNRLKDIQPYIDCGLPSILIPINNSWLTNSCLFYRPKRKDSDMLDLSDLSSLKIGAICDIFSDFFGREISSLHDLYDSVELKFGWFNNIEE